MRTVYKYPVPEGQAPFQFEHEVPDSPQLVHFGPDPKGVLCVWAEVDTDNAPTKYKLMIAGTGQEIPDNAIWLRSCVEGDFVWHLYLMIPEQAMAEAAAMAESGEHGGH